MAKSAEQTGTLEYHSEDEAKIDGRIYSLQPRAKKWVKYLKDRQPVRFEVAKDGTIGFITQKPKEETTLPRPIGRGEEAGRPVSPMTPAPSPEEIRNRAILVQHSQNAAATLAAAIIAKMPLPPECKTTQDAKAYAIGLMETFADYLEKRAEGRIRNFRYWGEK